MKEGARSYMFYDVCTCMYAFMSVDGNVRLSRMSNVCVKRFLHVCVLYALYVFEIVNVNWQKRATDARRESLIMRNGVAWQAT